MISMDKQYTTRDGRPVRVLCVDAKGDFPVVAVVDNEGSQEPEMFTQDGFYYSGKDQSSYDLIEVKPKRTVEFWLNHYDEVMPAVHKTLAAAVEGRMPNCFATTHHTITFEEGEGL